MLPEIFTRFAGTAVAICYPAYLSFKALKADDEAEIQRLTIYWIVFAVFKAAEFVGDTFIFWFPFYYDAKLFFQLWLLFPRLQGANWVYTEFVLPRLIENEQNIDDSMTRAGESFMREGSSVFQKVVDTGRKFIGAEIQRYLGNLTASSTGSRSMDVDDLANESLDMSEYDIINQKGGKNIKKKSSNTSMRSSKSGRSRAPSENTEVGSSSQATSPTTVASWLNWLASSMSNENVAETRQQAKAKKKE